MTVKQVFVRQRRCVYRPLTLRETLEPRLESMDTTPDQQLRFWTICPTCKKSTIVCMTRCAIREMLSSRNPIVLNSACHSAHWNATRADRDAMIKLLMQ
jgi:hypothetical protein